MPRLSFRRSLAIARQDWRVLRQDPFPVIVLVVLPLVLVPFLKPAFHLALTLESGPADSGAGQAVPGMAITFAFFLVGNASNAFFREHAWRTWDRLRASAATTPEIVLGKLAVPYLQALIQFSLVFGAGAILLDLHVRGSWLAMIGVGLTYSLFLVLLGVLVTAVCRTYVQVYAVTYVGALVFAGFAGALVPHSLLPPWAQALAPLVPAHWAMDGYRAAITGSDGALTAIVVLLGFSLAVGTAGGLLLRTDETKVAWT
ncbi:MAG TPA: ABC transporter permease [Solirubrobacterales bacterium]|jgi:ABC-2 type transport system permease protein